MVFGHDKKSQNSKKRGGSSSDETAVTILTSGCHFTGKLFCKGSSRIGGRIEGEIISEGVLIIEEDAFITAHIQADDAIIQGTVKGSLEAKGKVELADGSRFEGDIITPALIVFEGAKFNGRSSMPVHDEVRMNSSAPIRVDEGQKKKGKHEEILNKKGVEKDDKFELTVL